MKSVGRFGIVEVFDELHYDEDGGIDDLTHNEDGVVDDLYIDEDDDEEAGVNLLQIFFLNKKKGFKNVNIVIASP